MPYNEFDWWKQIENTQTYGWDNEFGRKKFKVDGFKTSQMLVSNGEYLEFIEDGGY